MLYQSIAYLKWLPKTFHLHGIHSPFIFNLEKDVLRGKNNIKTSQQLATYRASLLASNEEIDVTDYGSGSRVFTSNKRSVKKIAKVAGATPKKALLLERLIAYFKPLKTLELGTSLGIATAALSINNENVVYTIEGCPNTAAIAQQYLDKANITTPKITIGDFKNELSAFKNEALDFIYFDGNHSKEATLSYVKTLLPTITEKTVWFFDDIHWSLEMTIAWDIIKKTPEISATIDCFWFGMVFFRPGQEKEDFYVRL